MSKKTWYQQTDAAVCNFFDVDPARGLTKKDALTRLAKFGVNKDTRLSDTMMRSLKTVVLREGHREPIPLQQLVPGDIVLLEPGRRVPADIRILHVNKLYINQGYLTGEVLPAAKNVFALLTAAEPQKQNCMAFAGTFVASGSGRGVVVERGSKLLSAQLPKTRRKKRGIKGTIIANRLRRFGVIVRNKAPLSIFRKISIVVIDVQLSDTEVLDIIRKVQLTRNIVCKFVVSRPVAERLSKELVVDVYDAGTRTGNLLLAQLITGLDSDNSLSVALTLNAMG